MIPLNQLPIGQNAVIEVILETPLKHRLKDLGFIPQAEVIPLIKSFGCDPVAYLICGTVIALRNQDAGQILVTPKAGE